LRPCPWLEGKRFPAWVSASRYLRYYSHS
jgi:hypothetical protein